MPSGRSIGFDPAVVTQAVIDGKMPYEIAEMLGITIQSLRQHCSNHRISLMRKRVLRIEPLTVDVPLDIFAQLRGAAEARHMAPKTLAREILRVVAEDNMWNAVLDDGLGDK